jgi:AcrR family transcriptional regulator
MSRLSREDWAVAALQAIASGGVTAVAIEPLALTLGTTKGSFYWHFRARDDLVVAALDLWEQRSTADIIADLESRELSPELRLRTLFTRVFDPDAHTSADVALLAQVDDPLVAAAMRRVTEIRIDYIASLLRQCGLATRAARRRAVFAYSAFLGHLQLRHSTPALLKAAIGSFPRYTDEVIDALLRG